MQRELFDFLNTDLQFVKGVGPVIAARFFEVLGGRRILDFLLHKPSAVRPREITDSVMTATPGDTITINLLVKSHKPGGVFRGRRRPTQIVCADKMNATVTLQFFGTSFLDYWLQKLPVGASRIVSGKLEFTNSGGATITHPDFVEIPENADKIPAIQAIYPSGLGLTQKLFSNVRDQIFSALAEKTGHMDAWAQGHKELDEFFDALRAVHFPTCADDLLPTSDAVMKLAYAELFAHQTAIAQARQKREEIKEKREERKIKYNLLEKFYSILPFELTGAQSRVIDEIFDDMKKSQPMSRLVQGDVGSGKTIVALAAAVRMAESGGQTVLMAPTDTLAQQHFAKLKSMCDAIGIVCDILTGRDKGAPRREKLISLKSGRTKLLIGTHALFSDDVEYKDLGLVIIDEQHRFGVVQRTAIRAKGNHPDLLALSATPIPRTLSMTIYGDMDVSIINEKPAGRLPIKTTKLSVAGVPQLVARLKLQIENGAKVFWVCPLVEESEALDLMAAQNRYDYLTKAIKDGAYLSQTDENIGRSVCPKQTGNLGTRLPHQGLSHQYSVGLVHGQMDKKERDTVMAEFADPKSKMQILVSTTVIEVGIDVPSATIMVIENAERFGMAALHQLRGRVGRGDAQSFCILMFGNNITPDGMKRLEVLCETDDGFLIAEQDLMMRGVGELLGTKQSGWIAYNFVDYREHRDLFKLASLRAREARELVAPEQSEGGWSHDLMFIFGREAKVGA